MVVTAKLRYLHIAPRKVRLVADLIRGKSVEQAQTILDFTNKRASHPLLKLLKSAVANAKNNLQLNGDELYISEVTIDEGPKLKRWRPVSRGRAAEIQKKTSHITLILDEIKKGEIIQKKKTILEMKDKAKKELEVPKVEISEKKPKIERPKIKPKFGIPKPKIERGIKRIFRRKAF